MRGPAPEDAGEDQLGSMPGVGVGSGPGAGVASKPISMRRRRTAVSSEPVAAMALGGDSESTPVIPKTPAQAKAIKDAVAGNFLYDCDGDGDGDGDCRLRCVRGVSAWDGEV